MTRRHVTPSGWAYRRWENPGAPALVLLHGFTGCKEFWAPLAERWAADWDVWAPDLPGHGESALPTGGLAEAAKTLASEMPPSATVVGYSLGGRLALHLATQHPERVSRLVLVGASAGLETEEARAQRRADDARWVRMLRHEGLDAFLTAWEALPLFAGHRQAPPARQDWLRSLRERQTAEGLARSLETFGLGEQASLHEDVTTLLVPTWWVAGAKDEKFWAIAEAMAARMPAGRAIAVAGSGHNVPFERPDEFCDLVGALAPRKKEILR